MSQPISPSTDGVAICTVVTGNYLHFALALIQSIRRFHHDLPIVVCVVDRIPHLPELQDDPHTTFVFADQLQVTGWRQFSFQYTAFELSCALKPSVIKYCFSRPEITRVVYLDSDIQLYRGLDAFLGDTSESSIVLTPHLLTPPTGDSRQAVRTLVAHSGVYNAGFLAVKQTEDGCRFLDWWQSILAKSSIVDARRGMYVDQRPLDLVPGLFAGVKILRQPGFHLAYWNMDECRLVAQGDRLRTECGSDLTLFHFSGIDPDDPSILSKYMKDVDLSDFPIVGTLLADYLNVLNDCQRTHYEALSYGYATLSDGTAIAGAWREAVRMGHSALNAIEDPFDVTRYPSLHRRFRNATPDALKSRNRHRRLTMRLQQAVKRLVARGKRAA